MIIAMVIAGSVTILFAVGVVVLIVKAHTIAQGEAIVSGDQVDGRVRLPLLMLKDVARGGEALGKFPQRQRLLKPEATHSITETVIPLAETGREVPHLVATVADIPRFSNQLHRRQYRVVMDSLKQRRILTIARRSANHRR